MPTIEEVGKIIFNNKYWKGGNGGNFKAPYSNNTPKPFEEAKQYRYICGVIPEYVVMVDIDNEEAFECRLNIAKAQKQHCIVIKSPNKGGHFFWFNTQNQLIKNNSGNKTLLTLSPVDYKTGIKKVESTGEIKKAKCAASLSKEDGSLREVLYANIKEDRTLDEIPFYDLPLKGNVKHDFLNMVAGDGRNNDLFSYMNPIKAEGYSYEQYLEVANLINTFILANPFEADEFDTVTRREAWDSVDAVSSSQFYSSKGQFLHNKFGDYLIEKYHIKKINGYIHTYQGGVYKPGYDAIERMILQEIQTLTRTKQNEVLNYIRIRTSGEDTECSSPALIPFKNGLLDVEHNELLPHSPEHIVTNLIPWNYNTGASCSLVDEMLDRLSCGDSQIRALLEEVGGVCMYRSNEFKQAFMLIGDKNNGKSTFISLLQSMLGNDNVSNLDFRELDGKFSTAMLYSKLANLGDDISDCYKEDISLFKKISSGDVIKAEEKGQKPFNFKPYAKLIFSANSKPRFNDPTGAGIDRFIIIPLNAKFTKNDPGYDPQIRYKLAQKEAVEYFIQLSIKGLQRVLDAKKFTASDKAQAEKDEYEKENNPILAFIEECRNDNGEIEGIFNEPTDIVFERYGVFCIKNNFRPMSKPTFSKRINQALGTIAKPARVNGKLKKCFIQP